MSNNTGTDKIDFILYNPITQYDRVNEIWTSLLIKCPHNYFLSWPLKELWLYSLPPECNPSFVVGFSHGLPVIAFFIGSSTTKWLKFFKFHHLSLSTALIPYIDSENSGNAPLLIDPNLSISLESLLERMPIKAWDEFRLIRCASIYQPNLLINGGLAKKYSVFISRRNSYYVDLEKVRSNNNDYLALLSKNRRSQIRRSIKEYEKMGAIRVQIAENLGDALQILDELIQLHQLRWTNRGQPGAFATEFRINFDKELISRRFKYGEIRLIRVSAGDHVIGCLYNLVYKGNVVFNQGGFNYIPGNYYIPGFVCNYFAITHYAKIGFNTYDFLEGEQEYKKILSTDHYEYQNVIVRKKNMKYKSERVLARLAKQKKKIKVLGDKTSDD
jgi:hypothetical protein